MELADTCFECAEIYEDEILPMIGEIQSADNSLATEDGSEGYADPKVKELVENLQEYLRTACGRLYTAGEQIKAAAEAYASEDSEREAAFNDIMDNDWEHDDAPDSADDWAQDTDRSRPIPGAPPYVRDTTYGGDDEGGPDYQTEQTE